ncbi:DUF4339 domain-containing protein [Lacipirellula limnantheis]|uniref:GYF domain-containing protein n=1 Tax=Lacipirellula limnantheis TaxID=2528024 RepID=A0A517U6V6_9BACT|nr:DUF4339 domain-containing protein [Lacipirellula limnantheis]QDT76354.1 hypothetical protein I41_56040 [Lacipirellula limnantheis]
MAKWFCLIDDKQFGPFEPAKLKQLADAGTLSPRHKVRREDMAQWLEANKVQGLFQPARTHAVPTHSAEGVTRLPPTAPQSRTQENASDDNSSGTVARRHRQQPQSSDNPISQSREKEEPEGMGQATKVVFAICVAITIFVFGVFVGSIAFHNPSEAINSGAVTAQLDKADQRQQADEQPRADEEAEQERQTDAQAGRKAKEVEKVAQKEQTTVSKGDDARLAVPGQSEVYVCVTESAFSRFVELAVAKDYLGMAEMELAGQVFTVPSGTKVKVIGRGFLKREVRVMEGQHIGGSGFVPQEFVTM